MSILGLVFLIGLAFFPHGYDFYAYWVVDPLNPYVAESEYGAFRYAPPIALLFAPLGFLPLDAAHAVWLALRLAALWYVARGWALTLVLLPPVWVDMAYGNVYTLYGAMIVAGYRHPAWWSFGVLTKVTPGVGLLWFLVRREWRALGLVSLVTAFVILVSLAVQGAETWQAWLTMLAARNELSPGSEIPIPLIPRLLAAIALVVWGARADRRWTVPVAVCIAMPSLWWSSLSFAPLIALWPRHHPALPGNITR